MNGDLETTKRKIRDGLQRSTQSATDALMTGVEALNRLKRQGSYLNHANDNLNPLATSGEMSIGLTNDILKNLQSGKTMFIICATVFVILLYLVIKWKHS